MSALPIGDTPNPSATRPAVSRDEAMARERRGDADLEEMLAGIRDRHLADGARIVLYPSGLVLDARVRR